MTKPESNCCFMAFKALEEDEQENGKRLLA